MKQKRHICAHKIKGTFKGTNLLIFNKTNKQQQQTQMLELPSTAIY